MNRLVSVLLAGVMLVSVGSAVAKPKRDIGDSKVVAPVPIPPGFPEGIAVNKDKFYVSGPAMFVGPGLARILEYDLDNGELLRSIPINQPVNNPDAPFALSQIAFDKDDRLYIVDSQQGVVRLNLKTLSQTVYSPPLPFLPRCIDVPAGIPCSPKLAPLPPLGNDIVFDKNGYAYVTDSFQGVIWRIPPGGGPASIWFADPRLVGTLAEAPFGVNGMRFDKKGDTAYIAVTFGQGQNGYIYTLPRVNKPTAAQLKTFHVYEPGTGPDGIAFGKSGNLYVALAGASMISELKPNGYEVTRYTGPASVPCSNAVLPWANPANIAFNDKEETLLFTNHASLTPNPEGLFAVIDVYVNDKAQKLETPKIP